MSDASPSVPARPSLAAVRRPAEESTEPLSFEDFYRKEHRHVLGLAFVLTGNRSAAEDVAQDAFTAAFRQWRSVAVCDAPGAWIRRVPLPSRRLGAATSPRRGKGPGASGQADTELHRAGGR